MSRQQIYFRDPERDPPTFAEDENQKRLPLPKLEDTLERYYQSLIPFGTEAELKKSREIIDKFRTGLGPKLHQVLEKRAQTEKNWVEKWWEDYAYLTLRNPLMPYTTMAQPLIVASVGIEESMANSLKVLARQMHNMIEFWMMLRKENLKAFKLSDGNRLSSFLYRRFYNTVRIPGELKDEIVCHFKTEAEGDCNSNLLIMGRGRIFKFSVFTKKGEILSPQQCLSVLYRIRAMLDTETSDVPAVHLLTCDNRDVWAKNREHLLGLSENNRKIVKEIEESICHIALDDNEPSTYSEVSQNTLSGDFRTRWADKSSIFVAFRNGKFGCLGEHSCYDGTISISVSTFMLLSLLECEEPDWKAHPDWDPPVEELVFDLDEHLAGEIRRMEMETGKMKSDIIVTSTQFPDYGKQFIKTLNVHPDSYIQMVLQLVYYRLHGEFAPTYETALLRFYYNGRTETVRSCTKEATQWVKAMEDSSVSTSNKIKYLREAINVHNNLQSAARSGQGIDRHLFGLWCVAYLDDLEIPELYDDPMYSKSGGGGNFVLSTSTLGFTINNGFVGPMLPDGYGVFYTITTDSIWLNLTTFRESFKTSNQKFIDAFEAALRDVKTMYEQHGSAKL